MDVTVVAITGVRIVILWALCATSGQALAQDLYPSRAVKIIAPVAAGTIADLVPRLVAEKLAIRWGHPI